LGSVCRRSPMQLVGPMTPRSLARSRARSSKVAYRHSVKTRAANLRAIDLPTPDGPMTRIAMRTILPARVLLRLVCWQQFQPEEAEQFFQVMPHRHRFVAFKTPNGVPADAGAPPQLPRSEVRTDPKRLDPLRFGTVACFGKHALHQAISPLLAKA